MKYWERLLLAFSAVILSQGTVQAVKFPDGTVAFESAILLQDSHTTFSGVRVRAAIYYFDLEVPQDAGEPLQKVSIQQRAGGDEVRFRLDKSKAYLGDHNQKQQELNVTTTETESGEIIVKLDRPIAPGNTLTIGIKPKRNPDFAGVYLFGVTAFPPGEKAQGLYLGAGRLHFYQGSDFRF